MEPSHDLPAPEGTPTAPAPGAELILETGRHRGTHRPLNFPATLIGRAAGCDLRLNVDGIAPLHCVLVHGAAGLVLRDLQNKDRTLVNGQPATVCILRHGDLLTVGPFRFQVSLPEVQPAVGPAAVAALATPTLPAEVEAQLGQQRDQLRLEREGITVRQAALVQDEGRLQQRRLALEQQREQMQARLKQEKEQLRRELDTQLAEEKEKLRREADVRLSAEKEALSRETEAVAAQRTGLAEEDTRLKQRWLTLDQQREQTQAKLRQEKDALRIQAAAVAAQQAALSEEEARLQQRRVALQQQEEQLSAHLEEKQRRLHEMQEQTREARNALQTERAAYEARVVQVMRDVNTSRAEVADGQRQVQTQRQHLIALRRRLKHRWHRHWAGERSVMQRREAEVMRQRRELEQEAQRLKREGEALEQARLRCNGECELGRRQLEAGWGELRQQQHQFQAHCAAERGQLQQRSRDLDRREAELLELEQDLADQHTAWETQRQQLEKEAEGLENRVRNLRRRVLDLEQEIARLVQGRRELQPTSTTSTAAPSAGSGSDSALPVVWAQDLAADHRGEPADPTEQKLLIELQQLADELADQRLHLAEQWQRLVHAQHEWCREHEAATVEWEAAGQRLAAREQVLESVEARLSQGGAEVAQARQHLEAWQARMAAREAAWDAERDRVLAAVEAREQLVEQRLRAVTQLHERWSNRRRKELEQLRHDHEAGERFRQECTSLREQWLERGAAVEQEQRSLAERTLALEQQRQEHVRGAADPEAVERRLEQLRRRWAMVFATAHRSLAQEREALKAEMARLEDAQREFQARNQQTVAEEAAFAQNQSAWERDQLMRDDEAEQLRAQVAILQTHHQRDEQELARLREEVDRLAQVLMADGDASLPAPVSQAA